MHFTSENPKITLPHGNAEGRDTLKGMADAAARDGPAGNATPKPGEGTVTPTTCSARDMTKNSGPTVKPGVPVAHLVSKLSKKWSDPIEHGGVLSSGADGSPTTRYGSLKVKVTKNVACAVGEAVEWDAAGYTCKSTEEEEAE